MFDVLGICSVLSYTRACGQEHYSTRGVAFGWQRLAVDLLDIFKVNSSSKPVKYTHTTVVLLDDIEDVWDLRFSTHSKTNISWPSIRV